MMNHSVLRQHVRQWLVIALLMPAAVMAQNTQRLSLFETVDSPSQSGAPDPAINGSVPTSNSVQFVLVGTSQIGDRQRARLRSPDGQTLTVELNPLGSASIPGYPGYEVSRISARELEVRHPTSTPCVPNREQGVTCAGTHQARLQLATAAPVVREQPATNQTQQVDPAQQNAADGGQPENPFAAALRAARERGEIPEAGATRADGARFRARRIDPADVPPGAQLIRTPFGDRIVVQ